MTQGKKLLVEMGPLLLFFAAYKLEDLIFATGILIVATLISVGYVFYTEKKIPFMPLLSALVLGIFGGLTVFFEDELFIKIKPTLVNLLFAAILLVGVWQKKGLLKFLFGSAVTMSPEAWLTFSKRWGLFFIFLALVNEGIWRHFDTEFWVKFKVFGMLPLTLLFMVTQIPFLHKHMKEDEAAQKP